jgi:hypothetical protein
VTLQPKAITRLTVAIAPHDSLITALCRPGWRDYLELTKPKVSLLIVFTAIVGMVLASPGMVPLPALVFGTLGIAMASGSAATLNHILDRRIDQQMARTRRRPLATGSLRTSQALVFAGALCVGSMTLGPSFPFEPFVSPSLTSWLCSVHSSPIIAAGCSFNLVVPGVHMVTLSCFRRVSSWQSRLLSTAMVGIASALLAASPTFGDPARPIVNEKFSDFAPAIAELRQEAGQDRRDIVRANMLLTETESARFWPLYDGYRAERQKIGDRRVRLITDFLAQKNSMSEDEARALANEDFAILKDTGELKTKWYKKMTKELSERTVARFFHIDEKLDAAADIALAANIPLIH